MSNKLSVKELLDLALDRFSDGRDINIQKSYSDQLTIESLGLLEEADRVKLATPKEKAEIYGLSALFCVYLGDPQKATEFLTKVDDVKLENLWSALAKAGVLYLTPSDDNIEETFDACEHAADMFEENFVKKEGVDALLLLQNASFLQDLALTMYKFSIVMSDKFAEIMLSIPWDKADYDDVNEEYLNDFREQTKNLNLQMKGLMALQME